MGSVREKVTYDNCCFDAPCTMIMTRIETPKNKRAKIRAFISKINGLLHPFKYRNKDKPVLSERN